jgi:hypothetical protein
MLKLYLLNSLKKKNWNYLESLLNVSSKIPSKKPKFQNAMVMSHLNREIVFEKNIYIKDVLIRVGRT